MESVKLSDALKFSRKRQARHASVHSEDEIPASILANDFGVEVVTLNAYGGYDTSAVTWSSMTDLNMRGLLLNSKRWEPVDPKPVMLIIAEAACDWSIHEQDEDEDEEIEEDGDDL